MQCMHSRRFRLFLTLPRLKNETLASRLNKRTTVFLFSGTRVQTTVENIDVFPTLVDLANLKKVPHCPHNSIDSSKIDSCAEGKSLAPLITPGTKTGPPKDTGALIQTLRTNSMGYSLVTQRYRCLKPKSCIR